jgi:hypothetical protein
MTDKFIEDNYRLLRNPYPPAASGVGFSGDIYIPKKWETKVDEFYNLLSSARGPKAFPVVGEYGSGKTALIKGYLINFFEKKRIKAFYFENPGEEFYDLANGLLRNLGRYEFSKALWERCKEFIDQNGQRSLFPLSFSEMLGQLKNRQEKESKTRQIQGIIKNKLKITDDEEIAYKLASLIIDTGTKPYFEYRDFIAGRKGALVAENEEVKYFHALIKAILIVYDADGVAFLIDEFEDVAISKRMSRKKSYDYLATLRHLVDLSQNENFWLIMAMTPAAAQDTRDMNPALWQRFTHGEKTRLELDPLSSDESKELISWWLDKERIKGKSILDNQNKLFPFQNDVFNFLDNNPQLRLPRQLVKIGFLVLAKAIDQKIPAPIPREFVLNAIKLYYLNEIKNNQNWITNEPAFR